MEPEIDRVLDEMNSAALASVRRSSGRLNQNFSGASSLAAGNLLEKAMIRLERGDRDAARSFVERALGLPYDEHEEQVPALWSAHMELFNAIGDDLENCEQGDHSWLDSAETLIERSSPVAAAETRRCLRSLLDGAVQLSSAEVKRIKRLTSGTEVNEEPFQGTATGPEQVEGILDVLQAVLDHSAP